MERFDTIVIGAGQAGGPLSRAWAKTGRKVALVERLYVGGTCANTGCTPTKTMVASARAAYMARRAADFGVHGAAEIKVSLADVKKRAQDIVLDFRTGGEKGILSAGVELIYGNAQFTGPHALTVALNAGGERQLNADQVFINAGARPAVPKLDGLDSIPYLDSTTIQQLESVPKKLLILGGGYVALEFGQMFRRFGSEVTIVEQAERLMVQEDDDVSAEMAEILAEDGIEVLMRTQAIRAAWVNNEVALTVRASDGSENLLTGTHLLVAAGRVPNTGELNLCAAGIETDDHEFVKTNSRLETTAAGVYAMGDCKGGPQFTHIAYDDFRILRANLLHDGSRTTEDRPIPYTMFTDPQLGRIGMTERQAREKGHSVTVAKLPMTEAARTIETAETRGFLKAVLDTQTEQILGCAMLCVDGGEIMTIVQTAMMGKLPYTALKDGVFAHPTLAESLNNLFMTLDT